MTHNSCDFLFIGHQSPHYDALKNMLATFDVSLFFSASLADVVKFLPNKRFTLIIIDLSASPLFLQIMQWLQTYHLQTLYAVIVDDSLLASPLLKQIHPDAVWFSQNALHPARLLPRLKQLLNLSRTQKQSLFPQAFAKPQTDFIALDPGIKNSCEQAQTQMASRTHLTVIGENGVGKKHFVKTFILAMTPPDQIIFYNCQHHKDEKLSDDFLQQAQSNGVRFIVFEKSEYASLLLQKQIVSFLLMRESLSLFQFIFLSTKKIEQHQYNGFAFDEMFLFFLKQFVIFLPPLRERRQELPFLAWHFLNQDQPNLVFFSKDFIRVLARQSWLTNLAELKILMHNMRKNHPDIFLTAKHLPQSLLKKTFYHVQQEELDILDLNYQEAKKRTLNKFHQYYIQNLLRLSKNNTTVAAEKAGLDRSNFKKIIKKYQTHE